MWYKPPASLRFGDNTVRVILRRRKIIALPLFVIDAPGGLHVRSRPTCVPTLDREVAYGHYCNRRKSELAISEFWRPDSLPAGSAFRGRGSKRAFLGSASPTRRVGRSAWSYARPNLPPYDCKSSTVEQPARAAPLLKIGHRVRGRWWTTCPTFC
jgi:hypothetical protein